MALSIDQMDLTNSGFDIGIVMQRDTVRRPVGDVGNASSFPFPVLYRQVHDATVMDLFDPGYRTLPRRSRGWKPPVIWNGPE